MNAVEAESLVTGHVYTWAQGIARDTSDDEKRIAQFVNEVLSHQTVRLWVSKEVARLTGQVH